MNDDKERLFTYIDKDLRTKIDDFIAKSFTKPYGALSYVVEDALRCYLELERPQNTQIHKNPAEKKPPRYLKPCLNICADLRDRGFTYQFSSRELDKSIENVRGYDRRTKRTWRNWLEKHGFVKWKSLAVLEFGDNGLLTQNVSIPFIEPAITREASA